MKSEIIRMLSVKQNTYRCLHTNTTDTAVQKNKNTDGWTNTDTSNNKTDHNSQDGNSISILQLHYPSKKIKPNE